MENIEKYPTSMLVNELSKRVGVKKEIAEPYETKEFTVEGPAIVLVVID